MRAYWARYRAWRKKRQHEALRAYQRSRGLYIVDEFAATPIARMGVGGLMPPPASVLPPPVQRISIDMRMIGADVDPGLGGRAAARKWATMEKAADDRPHLSGLMLRLCDEHEQMQKALRDIAGMSVFTGPDPYRRRAFEGLQGIES